MCSIKHSYICWREQSYETLPVCILPTLQHQNISTQSMCRHSQGHGQTGNHLPHTVTPISSIWYFDHEILLRKLEKTFSIKGTVKKCIETYLTNWYQYVIIGDVNTDGATSDPIRVTKGIPKGSVLGFILFILYTSSLCDLCRSHGLNYQLFADDQKIYMSFKPGTTGTPSQCMSHLEACIEDTNHGWTPTCSNLIMKTIEFIILGTRQQLANVNEISIKVGNAVVRPVPNVRDLGFFLDCLLRMDSTLIKFVANWIHYSITYTKYDHTSKWIPQKY